MSAACAVVCLLPAANSGAAAAGAAKGPVNYRVVKHFKQHLARGGHRVMALLQEWQPSWVTGGSSSVQGAANVRLVCRMWASLPCSVLRRSANLEVITASLGEGVGGNPRTALHVQPAAACPSACQVGSQ